MLQSHVIEVNGAFVGAAITTGSGFRFRAVHLQVEELDESTWQSLDELKRVVKHLFTTGRLGVTRAPALADPLQSAARSLLRASTSGPASWME